MRSIATANVLAIGTELLTPYRIDTNSLFLTARLNELGIDVTAKGVVGDDLRDLERALAGALQQCDLVITTGGLGPTADDLTREAVSAVLGLTMDEDPMLIEQLRERFARRRLPMPDINRRQAMVPRGAVVLPNPRGSAPGLLIPHGDQLVLLLPGPPRELEPMFEQSARSLVAARTGGRVLRRRVIKIAGEPESRVDEIAAPIYGPLANMKTPVSTTILASPGQVELHCSARGTDGHVLDTALEFAVAQLANALGDSVFSTDGRAIEVVVGDLLKAKHLTLALAESCTGGMVAARLTDVPGSSAYVQGGVVAYANAVKQGQLNVPAEMLAAHGAVSEPVAGAMADGVRRALGADVGLAITGIAGPDGGTEEKPVGMVCFSVSGPGDRRVTVTRVVPGDRHVIRQWSVMVALDLVRRAVR
jgi:nicotinamide-nucleotide amidase